MYGKKENNLIIIENGQLTSYMLDDKNVWEVGRPSKENIPDIKLHSATVSRRHGKFQNLDGEWFYLDYNGKNGTVYNQKHIKPGINGRVRPVMLKDGDRFVFGGGEQQVLNYKTILGLFLTKVYGEDWRVVDSKGYSTLRFLTGEDMETVNSPEKGTVIEKEKGIAIYMGDVTYLAGDIEMTGC